MVKVADGSALLFPPPAPSTSQAAPTGSRSSKLQAEATELAGQWLAIMNDIGNPNHSSSKGLNLLKQEFVGSEALTDDLRAGVDLNATKSASFFVYDGGNALTYLNQSGNLNQLDNGGEFVRDQALVSSDGKTALRITPNGQLQEWHDGKETTIPILTGTRNFSMPNVNLASIAKEAPDKQALAYFNNDLSAFWNGKDLQLYKSVVTESSGKSDEPFNFGEKLVGQISGAQLTSETNGYVSVNDQNLVVNNTPVYVPRGWDKVRHMLSGVGHWIKHLL